LIANETIAEIPCQKARLEPFRARFHRRRRYGVRYLCGEWATPRGNGAGDGDDGESSNRDTEGTRHRLCFISSPTLRRRAASDDKGFSTASNWPDRLGVTAPWRTGARNRSRLRGSRLTNRRDGLAALRRALRRGCFLSRFRRNLAAGAATRSAPPMKITTRRSLRRVVLNVIDGCIPSDMAVGSREQVEEERRLLYVAMTRARQHLHLVQPMRLFRSLSLAMVTAISCRSAAVSFRTPSWTASSAKPMARLVIPWLRQPDHR
jgi:hypothetical protein